MALTRAHIETILVKRLGGWMTEAGLDVTQNGNNPDLNDAIGYGLRRVGGVVTDLSSVVDADVAGIDSTQYDALLDIAEWRVLETIARGLRKVDTRVGPLSQSFSQLRRDVMEAIQTKRAQIESDYDFMGASLEAGVITLDLAFKDADLDFQDA